MSGHRFPYRWNLADGYPAKGIESHKTKVFGTFICGGGSSMGYKLAGYDHIGGVEIDPKVAAIYKENHHPRYLYNEDLRAFNQRRDLPDELYQLDLLDGSPPCSTFSMAGSRENAWGKAKQFAEGQAFQTLDDLVFVYVGTILKLMPKAFILENVKGLVAGNAKSYVKRLLGRLHEGGYICQVFLFNSSRMGVPQARERTFIIGRRKELGWEDLHFDYHEDPIYFRECIDRTDVKRDLPPQAGYFWDNRVKTDTKLADAGKRLLGKNTGLTRAIVHSDRICPTLTTGEFMLYDFPRFMNSKEIKLCGSFPMDYKAPEGKIRWLAGMSVPPVMTENKAYDIYQQWFKKQ